MKSTKQMEEADLYLSEILSGLYRTNISELNCELSFKFFKGMLKYTYNFYNNIIYDLVDDCRINAAMNEVDDYISELRISRSK